MRTTIALFDYTPKSRVAARSPDVPRRAGRVAKPFSNSGAARSQTDAVMGKKGGPGTSQWFARFADACEAGAAQQAASVTSTLHVPGLRPTLSKAEFYRQATAGYATTAARDAAIAKATAHLSPFSDPGRDQQKPNKQPEQDTPEGVAANVLAAARRAGVIR